MFVAATPALLLLRREQGAELMTEPRRSVNHTRIRQEGAYPDLASTGCDVWAVAGRTAYREEFHRDYGPDADESRDSSESGREF